MHNDKLKRFIFIVTTSLFWFSLYTYVPIFPGYIENSGVSHSMVGIIIGSYGFSQMIIRIPLGIISDRLNKRKLFILLGIIFSSLSGLGLWLFSGALSMLFFRSLAGVAAASWVAFSVLFSSYYRSDETTKASGYISAANNIGQVLAMSAGSSLAGSYGARSSFILAFAAAVAAFASGSLISENKDITKKPLSFAELASVVRTGNLIIVSVLAILSQFVTYATVYGFTPIVAKSLGASSTQLGLLSTLSILPGIPAGALSGSYFAKKFGEKKTLIAGFIVVAFSCIVIPFIKNVPILIITQIIGGFGRGVIVPLLMGLCIKNVEENKRGSAMGFYQAIYGLGMFTGPVAVGFISDAAGLNIGFYFAAFIGIAAALMAMLFLKES
ncbi:MAG: MFS transporter [Clostridiales bacterium]|nr:MFS transporter [Clostridiales bacterium]